MNAEKHPPRSWLRTLAQAIVLASVAAVILPMPRYAVGLGRGEYVVWLARLVWVLGLTAGAIGLVLAVGCFAQKWQGWRSKP